MIYLFGRIVDLLSASQSLRITLHSKLLAACASRIVPTERPTSDPDIQHLPFFAISPVFFKSLYSSYYKRVMAFDAFAKVLIPFQAKLYYIVLSLARFNLYALSYTYLVKTAFEPKRAYGGRWWWWSEIVCLGLFYTWFVNVLIGCGTWQKALVYLLVSHVAASPVHVQVSCSVLYRCSRVTGFDRSCCRISRAPQRTWESQSLSSLVSYGRRSTLSVRHLSSSSTVVSTSRLPTISSLACPVTTCARLV